MKNGRIEASRRLYDIAAAQQGYFTTAQACSAGFNDNLHSYHVKNGNWIREYRGIYRLARFPESEYSHLVIWSLWSCDRNGTVQGIYSHETALSLYDLSDVNPSKLHLIVPPQFRRTAKMPEVLRLHKGVVKEKEYEERQGYKVLKPLPTIIRLINEKTISEEIIIQALRDGMKKGYLMRKQLMEVEIPTEDKNYLIKLLEMI
jgi:predicted transcriptional regulator of viral defense system